MERDEVTRRLQDLSVRCERAGIPTATAFLTEAEQTAARQWLRSCACRAEFFGGYPDAERKALFFLPDYLETLPEDALCAVQFQTYRERPTHRDYLGALLASGVRREWLGDILIDGETATVFCLPSVAAHLVSVERIGRAPVRAAQLPLSAVQPPEKKRQVCSFTVQSLRLDAVTANLFRIPRSAAAKHILAGLVKRNDEPCLKPDAPVQAGDVLSLRGYGKGRVLSLGGMSRKGRCFLEAERYL